MLCPAARLTPQPDYVRLRIDDALDLRRQCLKGRQHLGLVPASVVDTSDAANRVGEASLADIGRPSGTRQQRASRPSQIVNNPIGNAASGIKFALESGEAAKRPLASGCEHPWRSFNARQAL